MATAERVMNIFLSIGAQYNDEQKAFATAFQSFLTSNDCMPLTVDDRDPEQPIESARKKMETADAAIVVAFTRYIVHKAIEKPGSPEEHPIEDQRYPTIWNQLEAAMAYGLGLPLFIIVESGLHQEAMLKDRLEYRALVTKLDTNLFKSDTFNERFKRWKELVRKAGKRQSAVDISGMTIGHFVSQLRPEQAWKIGTALFGVAAAAFWLGKHL